MLIYRSEYLTGRMSDSFMFLEIDPFWDDDEIWNYAYHNNLIIITKDKDFRLKQLISGSPPKIIHIKFGNLVLKDFEKVINSNWNRIEKLIANNSIVNVFYNTVEAIK